MTKNFVDAKALTDLVIEGLLDKKGQHIVRMDLRNSDGAATDFFVICTGTSDRHVEALADSVLKTVKEKASEHPVGVEGKGAAEWVLVDYFNVVVHIFQQEKRAFYRLEQLWGDAESESIPETYVA